jgi:hypothetical protein
MSELRPYVRSDTSDHMSGLETVCSLRGFQGEPHFSPLILLFFKSTTKTIKGFEFGASGVDVLKVSLQEDNTRLPSSLIK